MTVLRIANWEDHFENNRTRELKHMDWVPIPNKMDGDGYTELLSHSDGAAHFGAWVALVEVASKCEPRGTLLRDAAKAHDFDSLARITRIGREVFDKAIPRLLQIGWLVSEVFVFSTVTEIPHEGAVIPHEGASLAGARRTERNGRERNGRERSSSAVAEGEPVGKSGPASVRGQPAKPDAADAAKLKRRSPGSKTPKPEHAEVKAYFLDQWKHRNGCDYGWKHARDDAHLKWVLDQVDRQPDKAKAIIDAFMQDEDEWLAGKGYEIGLLVSRWNRYRAKSHKPADDDRYAPGFVPVPIDEAEATAIYAGIAARKSPAQENEVVP